MNKKMNTSYLPIDLDYFELLEKEVQKESVRVFYFNQENYPNLDEIKGKASRIEKDDTNAYYMFFENNDKVRLDRIVVFNGIPGPAYDEYDAFALAPLTCKAGYDDEDC